MTDSSAVPAPETATIPGLPYDAKLFTYGRSDLPVERLTKVYRDRSVVGGELLTPDELAVWDVVVRLHAEGVALKAENERLAGELAALKAAAANGKGWK